MLKKENNLKELDIKNQSNITTNAATNSLSKAISLVLVIGILVGFILLSFSFMFIDVVVEGPSMQPTINAQWSILDSHKQDTVYINRFAPVQKSDIIVVNAGENLYVIKRLIAKEGDEVEIRQNTETLQIEVVVNNEVLEEEYVVFKAGLSYTLNNFNNLKVSKPELFEGDVLIVPEKHIFYLGDNRGESQDCSYYGPVNEEELVGRVDIMLDYGTNMWEYIWDGLISIFN